MREEDLDTDRVTLQETLQHLLGYTWTAGWSLHSDSVSRAKMLNNHLVVFQKLRQRNEDMKLKSVSSETFWLDWSISLLSWNLHVT